MVIIITQTITLRIFFEFIHNPINFVLHMYDRSFKTALGMNRLKSGSADASSI